MIAPASADVITGFYSGTMSGTDTDGLFGTADTVYTDVAYTGTISYATSGYNNVIPPEGLGIVGYLSENPATAGLVSVTLTALGTTITYTGDYQVGEQYFFPEFDPSEFPNLQEVKIYDRSSPDNGNHTYGFILEADTTTVGAPDILNESDGIVQAFSMDPTHASGDFTLGNDDFSLTIANITIGEGNNAPEPASVTLLGFGCLGLYLAGRRKRDVTAIGSGQL
jgi:hypothetical protein